MEFPGESVFPSNRGSDSLGDAWIASGWGTAAVQKDQAEIRGWDFTHIPPRCSRQEGATGS